MSIQNKTQNVYFKGLHALRFFAALLVLISHVEMIKAGVKMSNIYNNQSLLSSSLESLGPYGVTFFFVLSGFLISYLLLAEKGKTSTVKVKNFYFRRILRIWPIYIIFTLIAFFVLPEFEMFQHYYFSQFLPEEKLTKLLMYLFFIPGFTLAFYTSVPWAGHLWSIGVEEQFYLAWPWLFKKVQKIKLIHLFRILITILFLKGIFLVLFKLGHIGNPLKEIIAQSKFECMIIGAIGAFWVFDNRDLGRFQWLTYKSVILSCFLATLFFTFFVPNLLQDVLHLLVSPLFLAIILGISFSKGFVLFEHKAFIQLGNWSYSIYLLHMVGVVLAVRSLPTILRSLDLFSGSLTLSFNILLYSYAILITLGLSAISYFVIERPFLNLKSKFAIIKSGK